MKLTVLLPLLALACNSVPYRWHSDIPAETASDSGACRSDLDCDASASTCTLPDFASCEGDCVQPPLDCVQDGDCEPDEVCQSYVVACSCAGDGYTCKLACTDDASCGPDETCDTQSGQCLSRSCDGDGYVCATGTTCVGGGGPDHGCQRNACALDSDCGDGLYCVDNACYSDLGTCAATGG